MTTAMTPAIEGAALQTQSLPTCSIFPTTNSRVGYSSVAAFLFALSLVACALLETGCSGSDAKTAAAAAKAASNASVPVAVATAQQKDMPYYLVGLGSVSAFYTVNVKSRVDGQLVQVNFREGQSVKEGELLALIDPRPYEVQLATAQAQLFKDQASLRDAKLNLDRFRGLLNDSGAMSQQQVDTQQSTVDQFDGAVRSDQAAIDNAKLQLVYCHITSPISGRIGLRQVDPGNIVHAADTNPMFIITQLQPIAVLFTLPEDNIPAVQQHMGKGQLEVDAFSRDDSTKLATGKLLTIDNQIDQTTGTGKLKAQFDNSDNALFPNQFVNVHLLLETRKDSTVIPAAAVQRGPQGTFVYAMKPDKTVQVKPITVAFTQNNETVVATGIAPNDVVVTDGQDKLRDGSKVEPRAPVSPNTTSQAVQINDSEAGGTP
ncbi:MAG: MdtA/MuxA family multidrug efflux RND transporter periplasmic adaptor subunit [Terriglobales bacterium]|jgi:multidrug efflux system membrane fusion protein